DWFNSLVEDFLKLLSDLVAFVLETIAAAAEAIAETAKKVAEAGLKLIEAVVRAAMAVLEMMLKAALLALIYAMYAVALYNAILTFGLLTLAIVPLSLIMQNPFHIDFLKLEFNFFGLNIKYETITSWSYQKFLDVDIPLLITNIYIDDLLIYSYINNIFEVADVEEIFNEPTLTPYLINSTFELIDDSINLYKFSVVYKETEGNPPIEGFPKLTIYKDKNYNNAYKTVVMEYDSGNNFTKGIIYTAEVPLEDQGDYEYEIEAVSNKTGIYVSTGIIPGPSVLSAIKPKISFIKYLISTCKIEAFGIQLFGSTEETDQGYAEDSEIIVIGEYSEPHGYAPKDGYPLIKFYKDNNYNKCIDVITMYPVDDDLNPINASELTEDDYKNGVKYMASIKFDYSGQYDFSIDVVAENSNDFDSTNIIKGPFLLPSVWGCIKNFLFGIDTGFIIISLPLISYATFAKAENILYCKIAMGLLYSALIAFNFWQFFAEGEYGPSFAMIGIGLATLISAYIIQKNIEKSKFQAHIVKGPSFQELMGKFKLIRYLMFKILTFSLDFFNENNIIEAFFYGIDSLFSFLFLRLSVFYCTSILYRSARGVIDDNIQNLFKNLPHILELLGIYAILYGILKISFTTRNINIF
ncbi:MAG: hypothetical protein ACP6IY_18720, partial [Promethearchaeia archaeon]